MNVRSNQCSRQPGARQRILYSARESKSSFVHHSVGRTDGATGIILRHNPSCSLRRLIPSQCSHYSLVHYCQVQIVYTTLVIRSARTFLIYRHEYKKYSTIDSLNVLSLHPILNSYTWFWPSKPFYQVQILPSVPGLSSNPASFYPID